MEEVRNVLGYESPKVEVLEVQVEKGFAGSDTTGSGEDMPWG